MCRYSQSLLLRRGEADSNKAVPGPPDRGATPRECRGAPSRHEIGGAPAVPSQNRPTNRGHRHTECDRRAGERPGSWPARRLAGVCGRTGTAPAGTSSGSSTITTGIGSLIQPGRTVPYFCPCFSTTKLATRRVTGQRPTKMPQRIADDVGSNDVGKPPFCALPGHWSFSRRRVLGTKFYSGMMDKSMEADWPVRIVTMPI